MFRSRLRVGLLPIRVACATLAFGASHLQAELVWSSTRINAPYRPGDKTVATDFTFKNAGHLPVAIASVVPGCTCVHATPSAWVVGPGESAQVHVELVVERQIGAQDRTIEVVTRDPAGGATTLLHFTTTIPETIGVAPRFLYWGEDQLGQAQEIAIVIAEPSAVTLSGVEVTKPGFTAELMPGGSPAHYRLVVRAGPEKGPREASIHLNALVRGVPRMIGIYLAVK